MSDIESALNPCGKCAELRAELAEHERKEVRYLDVTHKLESEVSSLRSEAADREEQKFGAMKAKINELVAHNEKIYEALRQMKEADIGHARVCPQHVKNIDPWVRESDLKIALAEVSSLRAAVKEARAKAFREAADWTDSHPRRWKADLVQDFKDWAKAASVGKTKDKP